MNASTILTSLDTIIFMSKYYHKKEIFTTENALFTCFLHLAEDGVCAGVDWIKYNAPMNISTKDGNAVIISEDDYNSLVETIYLSSDHEQREKIIEGLNTPLKECISENEVVW